MVSTITLALTGLSTFFLLAIKHYFSFCKLSYVFLGMGVVTGLSAVWFESSMFQPTIAFLIMAFVEAQSEIEAIEDGKKIYLEDPTLPFLPMALSWYLTSGTNWWSLDNMWNVVALSFLVLFHLVLLIVAIIFLKQNSTSKRADQST